MDMKTSTMDVGAGDIVRLETDEDSTWFYCRVDAFGAGDELVCTVIDAQSWPSLALSGYLPGREYRFPMARVLSVVTRAPH